MADRTAATAGFTIAGIAFAASLIPETGDGGIALTGAAALTLVAFGLRRYGYVGRPIGAPVAGGAGVATALFALGGIFRAVEGAILTTTLLIVGTGGIICAVAAYADWVGLSREQLIGRAETTAVATAIGLFGLVAIVIWSVILASLVPVGPDGELEPALATAISTVALGLGTGTVAVLYLRWTDRDLGFIDAGVPTARGALYVVGGTVVILGLNFGVGAVFDRLGIDFATHSLIRAAESDPEILLVLVPLSILVVGPGEELLYRNIVQKSLYGVFSRPAAIVVASAIFAGVHIFAYSGSDTRLTATIVTLGVIFLFALVLGTIYERTRNVVVSALAHGLFNAIGFAYVYVRLSGLL